MIRVSQNGLRTRITQKNMAGISVSKICIPFSGGGGVNWAQYWATRLPYFALPATGVSLMVGQGVTIYGDALINVPIGSDLTVTYTCDIGSASGNNYTITPSVEDIGAHSLRAVFVSNGIVREDKTFNLNVYAAATDAIKVLLIGDSTTANGISYIKAGVDAMTTQTITYLGTKGTTIKHEGIPGASWLTLASSGSPFYKDGAVDVEAYFVDNSIDTPDYVVIRMGVNDMWSQSQYTPLTSLNTTIIRAKQIIAGLLAYDENIKVIIALPTICENTGAGWNTNYDETVYIQDWYIEYIHQLWDAYVDEFDAGTYDERVSVSAEQAIYVDRNDGYPKTDDVHMNALHPDQSGYNQIGNGIAIGLSAAYFNAWYGIEYDEGTESTSGTRIAADGHLYLHASLPIQNSMKGCLLDDDGSVNYYLDPADWTKQEGGLASNLDGTDGMVMVEIDDFYYKVESNYPSAGKYQVKIAQYPLPGFKKVPKHYISAYEAAMDRTNTKFASVVNSSAQYRGGGNYAEWDALSKSLLGKPVTFYTRATSREIHQSRGSGWNMYSYSDHKWLTWLFAIEYNNVHSQSAVNGTLTDEGYKQGGLGNGVSTTNNTNWNVFNSSNPIINCGASDSLGNGSGEVAVTVEDFLGEGSDQEFMVARYRGVENPFGHIGKICDGVNIECQSDVNGGESRVYTSDDPSDWNDDDYDGYENVGLAVRTSNFVSKIIMGENADIVASEVVASGWSKYYADWFAGGAPASGTDLRMLVVGGWASYVAQSGFFSAYVLLTPSQPAGYFGQRLRYQAE